MTAAARTPRPMTSPMTRAVRPAPRVMTSYQSPPTAASVPPGWYVAATRRSSGCSSSCGSRERWSVTAAARWRASLARSRSVDSTWSVTSAPKTRTPLCGATQATSGSGAGPLAATSMGVQVNV